MLWPLPVLGLAASVAVAPIQRQPLEAPRLCADLRPPKPAASEADQLLETNRFRFRSSRIAFQDNHDQLYNSLVDWTTTAPARKRTLVHFDYHSDLYRNDSHLHAAVNVGNFINFLVAKGIIDEIVWILPDSTRSRAPLANQWGCATIQSQNELYWGRPKAFVDWQFRDGPADQTICVAPSGHFTFKDSRDPCETQERAVRLRKRTLADILHGRSVQIEGETILDVDMDFFDHSGLYANEDPVHKGRNIGASPRCYSLHYPPADLQNELARFMIAITEKMDLYPTFVFVSRSPGYATQHTQSLQDFFEKLRGLSQPSE